MSIPFIDLKAQAAALGARIDAAIGRVRAHGQFIGGPEVADFERRLAAFCGARHAISCANGTDALSLVLRAEGVGPGDAVFAPSFTFVATAEVVPIVGATPIFVDVRDDTFNMDPASLEAAIAQAQRLGLTPRAVIAVDLFGLAADYAALGAIAKRRGMTLIADSAQGFGASFHGRRSGALADWTTTSFFPAKPLGCYGDGGAVFTDDDARAALVRSLAAHGADADRRAYARIGVNSRLDTIQAAILIEKLAIFEDEIAARNRIAARYAQALAGLAQTPAAPEGLVCVWAQYTIQIDDRDAVAARMKEQGVPTAIHYATPLHRQPGYRHFPRAPGGLPVSERLSRRVLSLPMHAYLDETTQDRIVAALRDAMGA